MDFNKLKAYLGVNPKDERYEESVKEYESNPEMTSRDAQKILMDRLKMGKPEIQGPMLGALTTLPAEEAQTKGIVDAVGGTVGSIKKIAGLPNTLENLAANEASLAKFANMQKLKKAEQMAEGVAKPAIENTLNYKDMMKEFIKKKYIRD